MTSPGLSVKNLATHFFTRAGMVNAVDGVFFDLAEGEIMDLVGESGSGKTVTGFSLLGLVDAPGRIVGGSVKLNGTELTTLSDPELRSRRGRNISMIFQDPIATLNPMLTIGQQIQMAIDAHERVSKKGRDGTGSGVASTSRHSRRSRPPARYPHEFSGSMRQRAAIAIALFHRPAVLVADEPTQRLMCLYRRKSCFRCVILRRKQRPQ